jgi:hypothetical protein
LFYRKGESRDGSLCARAALHCGSHLCADKNNEEKFMRVSPALSAIFAATLLLGTAAAALAAGGGGGGGGGPAVGGGPGGGGGGGGGTAVPPPQPKVPLAIGASESLIAFVGHPTELESQVLDSNRQPTLELSTAPAGMVVNSQIVSPPIRGGSWSVIDMTNAWVPTRDQLGLNNVVFTATDPVTHAAVTQVIAITVLDAPDAVTGLTSVTNGDQLTLSWQPSASGGVDPISYRVDGCYRLSPSLRSGGCIIETITTTADTTVTIPADHTPQFAGDVTSPYISIQVTPIDANGVAGEFANVDPTLPPGVVAVQ